MVKKKTIVHRKSDFLKKRRKEEGRYIFRTDFDFHIGFAQTCDFYDCLIKKKTLIRKSTNPEMVQNRVFEQHHY